MLLRVFFLLLVALLRVLLLLLSEDVLLLLLVLRTPVLHQIVKLDRRYLILPLRDDLEILLDAQLLPLLLLFRRVLVIFGFLVQFQEILC